MIHIALIRLELAREHMSEAAKELKKRGTHRVYHDMVWTLADFWEDILKLRRRSFLTHAVKSGCLKAHDYDWLNVRL